MNHWSTNNVSGALLTYTSWDSGPRSGRKWLHDLIFLSKAEQEPWGAEDTQGFRYPRAQELRAIRVMALHKLHKKLFLFRKDEVSLHFSIPLEPAQHTVVMSLPKLLSLSNSWDLERAKPLQTNVDGKVSQETWVILQFKDCALEPLHYFPHFLVINLIGSNHKLAFYQGRGSQLSPSEFLSVYIFPQLGLMVLCSIWTWISVKA